MEVGWRFPKKTLKELVVSAAGFGFAGLASIVIDLAVFNLLIGAGFPSRFASLVSILLATGANFIINYWVFSSKNLDKRRLFRSLYRYGIVAVLSALYLFVMFEIVQIIATDLSQLGMSFVRVALILSGSVIRFLLSRHWIYQ